MKINYKNIKTALLFVCLSFISLYAQEENGSDGTHPTREITISLPFSRGNQSTITVEEINGKLIYQGDIIIEEQSTGRGGAAATDDDFKWPNATVPYVIASGHPKRADILWAINHVSTSTNLCVIPRTTETDYVEFVYTDSICGRSRIGKRPSGGRQIIEVGDHCGTKTKGSTAHEILHAIGFYHEQSRDDRDTYITVNTANIKPESLHNFEKYNQSFWHYFFPEGQNLGTYDYGSLMHYGSKAFGKPASGGPMTTIVPKTAGATIGQRNGLSPQDIRSVNTLYPIACSAAGGSTTTASTGNGGSHSPAVTSLSDDPNVAIDISYPIRLIPQTTHMSCWATSAAMIVAWRESENTQTSFSINPEDIARQVGGWREFFNNQGLPPDNTEMFRIWGFVYEHPQSYTVEGFAQLMRMGPLWVATDLNNGAHVVVVSAMRGDGTPDGTILTIMDPWEEGMPSFRPSNQGSTYEETYTEFVERQERLARAELDEPTAFYIAY